MKSIMNEYEKYDSAMREAEIKARNLIIDKAAAFDWLVDQIKTHGEFKIIRQETGDGGHSCGQTWFSMGFGGTTDPMYITEASQPDEVIFKAMEAEQ